MSKKFLGGLAIGLGCIAYVSVDNKYIGAFLFSIGLLTICARGWELFTGKLCGDASVKELALTWVFNALGVVTAAMSYLIFGRNVDTCMAIIEAKTAVHPFESFVSAIFCEMCIYIAVTGYKEISSDLSKNLSVIMGVMVFILCGFEHCIADVFYACYGGWDAIVLLVAATAGNVFGARVLNNILLKQLGGEP